VIDNIFINFAIPCRLFEIWAEEISTAGSFGAGFASFQGFIYPVFYLLKNSIGLPIPSHINSVYDITNRTVTEWVSGGTYMHNAYVSIFWYFYYDFRTVGVILISFLMGFRSQRAYRRAISHPNVKSVSLYCAFACMLVGSYSEMTFSKVGFGVGYLFLLFAIFKRNKDI
jgi:oligosaccharide repeat unit polymerase